MQALCGCTYDRGVGEQAKPLRLLFAIGNLFKMPYLYALWRFINAYDRYIFEGIYRSAKLLGFFSGFPTQEQLELIRK